jgi:hypothetical protein
VAFAHSLEYIDRSAALDHEIFRNYLDKIDRNRSDAVEEISVVRLAKAEAEGVLVKHMRSPGEVRDRSGA